MKRRNWRPWTDAEITWFLAFNDAHTAEDLARSGNRSVPAVMGMRRKLLHLRQRGASNEQLPRLLRLSQPVIETRPLRTLVAMVRTPSVKVRHFL
jgi:hypothetical protein